MIDGSRVMVFIDGTNLLTQLSRAISINFRAEKPPHNAIILSKMLISKIVNPSKNMKIIRHYWFSSYQGNEETRKDLRNHLRESKFEPVLFKLGDKGEKGVDIALTKEMLVNAFQQNYDIGVLIAGDEDYVGIVNEVKRYGQVIWGAFFEHGLSPELKYSFDTFFLFTNIMRDKSFINLSQPVINRIKVELDKKSN